jgi:CYTH domain-containing protein
MSSHMEIERRFLVDGRTQKPWRSEAKSIHNIEQYYLQASNLNLDADGYLCLSDVIMIRPSEEEIVIFQSQPDWIPRIRIKDGVSIFTVKGPRQGASGLELEWGPFPNVQKTRYCVVGVDDFIWEIDEFEGELAGLILAEVELPSEQQPVELPPWIGLELTGLRNWSNAALAETLMANL